MWKDKKIAQTLKILLSLPLMAHGCFLYPVWNRGGTWCCFSLDFLGHRRIVIPKRTILVTDVNKCHELLEIPTLEKRASLNQRLVTAFGIENGFTTTDQEIHHAFRKEVKDIL